MLKNHELLLGAVVMGLTVVVDPFPQYKTYMLIAGAGLVGYAIFIK